MTRIHAIIIAVFVCLLPSIAAAEDTIDAAILAEMDRRAIPGLVAVIVKDDAIVWSGAYGLRNIDSEIAADAGTVFLLSSISKLFVAIAIMQQYERGHIDLDEDINAYLPFEVRNPAFPTQPITARHLLTHQSGLANPSAQRVPSVNEALPPDSVFTLFPWIRDALVPRSDGYDADIWTSSAPGAVISSSNMGVTLLAYLVGVVSGENFAAYCHDNIFVPLAMFDTSYRLTDIATHQLATLYIGQLQALPLFGLKLYPAGMLRSTVPDLAHFLIAIMNGGVYEGVRILQSDTVALMLDVKYPHAGLAFQSGVALMWRSYEDGDDTWLGHTGGGGVGITASMDFDADNNIGVIILCNAAGRRSVSPGGTIYELLHRAARTR